MTSTKHDNSNPAAKIALRNHFLARCPPKKILECYAGEHREMYHTCYTGQDVTALDLKKGENIKTIDNRQYVRTHADEYDYFDMDAYGSPYELLVTLFAHRRSKDPFTVIVTDGTKLQLNYQHASNIVSATANLSVGLQIPQLYRFQDELIWYILRAAATRFGITISDAKIARGDTGNMKYYGFVAQKIGP